LVHPTDCDGTNPNSVIGSLFTRRTARRIAAEKGS
jgi:hypothetical protein